MIKLAVGAFTNIISKFLVRVKQNIPQAVL
jgi:hypothetical protein